MNPEFRQTLSAITHNLETANQAAQENIYTFTQLYIDPCLAGFKSCLSDCTAPCFPNREGSLRRRRARGRSRGRAENFFDFYDDWDEEEANAGGTAWGNDELDSLLAGRGSQSQRQPQRQRTMSYGSRGRPRGGAIQSEAEQDPTIIPGSSYLGFLERLPGRIGQRVLRYKPSAANLQENPGGLRMADAEAQPLLEEDEDMAERTKGHTRQRSGTQNSRSTTNSLSSRGDLIMSEEEEDAREIDEEFAIALGRRTTNTGVSISDHSSGKTGSSGKRPGPSRRSTRTVSSKSNKSSKTQRSPSQKSLASQPISPSVENVEAPSMQELRQEEVQVQQEEELEIQQKRQAAQQLAESRGLSSDSKLPTAEVKPDLEEETEPFPSVVEVDSPRPVSPEVANGQMDSELDDTLPSDPPSKDKSQQEPP